MLGLKLNHVRKIGAWYLPGLVSCYNGVLIGSLSTLDPDVAGDVYAWDERRLLLKNFTFNGDELSTLSDLLYIHIVYVCVYGKPLTALVVMLLRYVEFINSQL